MGVHKHSERLSSVVYSCMRWGRAPKPSAEAEPTTPSAQELRSPPAPAAVAATAVPEANRALQLTIDTRRETLESAKRIEKDLEQIKQIEVEALATLHKDLDTLRQVDGSLVRIENNMERAKVLITALTRKLWKDGCFKILVVLLGCAISIVIILVVTDSLGKLNIGGKDTIIIKENRGDAETTTAVATTTRAPGAP